MSAHAERSVGVQYGRITSMARWRAASFAPPRASATHPRAKAMHALELHASQAPFSTEASAVAVHESSAHAGGKPFSQAMRALSAASSARPASRSLLAASQQSSPARGDASSEQPRAASEAGPT